MTATTGFQPYEITDTAHSAPAINELDQYSRRSFRGSPFTMGL